ncbi:MAG: guanylate kinase [Flavobacteriales bacterium]|jgi:guanylate kinase|nr:guanylate kinase [Flavobacteriales bacterium]
MAGKAIIISAPSGAGKTSIVHQLMQWEPRLAFSISATSRPRRAHEEHGRDYFFMTAGDFQAKVAAGELLEWQEVYPGRYYGTLRSEVERIQRAGHIPIFDVDVVGGLDLKRGMGTDALAIFVAPPSLEVLEYRLRMRGTETPDSLRERVGKAEREIAHAPRFDLTIVNDDLARACHEARAHVQRFIGP